MIYTLDEIAERVRPVAEKYNLPAIYVFGSYARGEATEESDVDLLVDITGATDTSWCCAGIFGDLEDAIGKEIDMVEVSALYQYPDILRDHWFIRGVQHDKVSVYAK
jgi:predicted nucleotidyltransferase